MQILITIRKSKISFSDNNILYTKTKQYPPNKKKIKLKLENNNTLNTTIFLSSKIFEIMILPELSSITMQKQPIKLITFPSFNKNQLTALHSEIQPSFYNLIHNIPQKNTMNQIIKKQLNL